MACRVFFKKVMLGLFFHMECRWVLAEPLPHHCGVIILHHTEVYSELDLLALFFLERYFKCTDDTVPCTEYINTPECLYWGDIGEEVYL